MSDPRGTREEGPNAAGAFAAALTEAARASGQPLPTEMVQACRAHFQLLVTWNRTHNLTRITDPAEAALKHYLDCLLPLLGLLAAPSSFVDVGSGAGFPGLMAALAWPDARGTLVEPAKKRASFLTLAAGAMGVRVEVREPGAAVVAPLVLSRATFSPGQRRELTRYAGERARIVVWGHRHDGPTWETEVATWEGWRSTILDYSVAGLEPRALLVAER